MLVGQRSGGTVSAVARAYEFATGALFSWRVELGYGRKERGEAGFCEAR